MRWLNMIPYEEFRRKMERLITHAIKRGVDLELFHCMNNKQCGVANETNRCGTIACVAGYAPELWPKEFEWKADDQTNQFSVRSKATGRIDTSIIWDIIGVPEYETPEYEALVEEMDGLDVIAAWPFENIFERNRYNFLDYDPDDPEDPWHEDDHVCGLRLQVIKECVAYDELADYIGLDTDVF
jgi:hypothetical protein